jgi:hypothetical protein
MWSSQSGGTHGRGAHDDQASLSGYETYWYELFLESLLRVVPINHVRLPGRQECFFFKLRLLQRAASRVVCPRFRRFTGTSQCLAFASWARERQITFQSSRIVLRYGWIRWED